MATPPHNLVCFQEHYILMFFNKIGGRVDVSSIEDEYEMFVKAYNETREQGGIIGQKCFSLQRLIKSDKYTKKKQESVTHVGKQNCYLSHIVNAIYVNITCR